MCTTSVVAYGPELKKHLRHHRFCPKCSPSEERWTTQIFGFPLPLILIDLLRALKTFLVADFNVVGTNDIGNHEDNEDSDVEEVCEMLSKF